MSFSTDTKQELCRIESKDCCKRAELAAFIHGIGSLRIGRSGRSLWMTTELPYVARRIFSLCKDGFHVKPQVRTQIVKQLGKRNVYHVVLEQKDSVQMILTETGLISEGMEGLRFNRVVPLTMLRKTCCKHAYLRGAFLATGTLSHPGKGYHLEMTAISEEYARSLSNLINKMEIPSKVIPRRDHFVVYLKESEAIIEYLNRMGAHKALLITESIRVQKNVRNNVNRMINCDNANVEKTMKAVERQMAAIRTIEQGMGIHKLPAHLQEIAKQRVDNPEMPMKELGECLDPPISKSAVSHRLNRLIQIAQELQTQKGE